MSDQTQCPFCGHDGDFDFRSDVVCGPTPTRVVSMTCSCGASAGFGLTPQACVDQWKTRPIEDALRARLAAAERERDELADALRAIRSFGSESETRLVFAEAIERTAGPLLDRLTQGETNG